MSCFGQLQDQWISAPTCQNLKFLKRPQLGSITPTIQIISTAHWSLKAAFLKKAPTVGTVESVYFKHMGRGE